jgi:hypothetical protein
MAVCDDEFGCLLAAKYRVLSGRQTEVEEVEEVEEVDMQRCWLPGRHFNDASSHTDEIRGEETPPTQQKNW